MKRLLPALLLFMLAAFSCRKEKSSVTPNQVKDSIITYQPPNNTKSTITSISPASGTAGTIVTITGSNFITSTTVSFNGVAAIIQSTTATEIKVIAPQSTSGSVSVIANSQIVAGPAFTYAIPVITAISPTSGASSMVVTIIGTDLGNSFSYTKIYFNGVAASVQSITPTEIKAIVPVTTTGKVTLTVGKQSAAGPVFTYVSIFDAPYISGDVSLTTQAEVDSFVTQNKGRQLQITGSLTISGADITSVSGLSNVTSVAGRIFLLNCPLLTDVSFLNSITSAGNIMIQNLVVSTIALDKLAGSIEYITVSGCTNLNSLSLKSLTGVTGNIFTGSIKITSCGQLSHIDCNSLTTVADILYISGTAIADLSGFASLKKAGSLSFVSNPSLVNFHGLEGLTTLSLAAVSMVSLSTGSKVNGLYISGNPKLTSLTGLQNITSIPVAKITSNAVLTDFCPLKVSILNLSTLANYTYKHNDGLGDYLTSSVPALTLTNNSSYAATDDALAAVKLCN